MNFYYILGHWWESWLCLHTVLHVLIGGLVNTGLFDLEDTECTEIIWTMGGLSTCLRKYYHSKVIWYVTEILVAVPGWEVLNLKPLTDSTICSPHTECNHTKLQSASNCRSFSLSHKLVLWKMSKSSRHRDESLFWSKLSHSVCVIQRHTVIKSKHPSAYAIWQWQIYCWLWGWILPWESKSHFLICVCNSDWRKINVW